MNDKERLLQLIDTIPDDKLAEVVEMLEALTDYWKTQTTADKKSSHDS